jgi:succinate-acetate transporter protein
MADESNVHVKVAMADVLGLLVISMFTAAVGIFGLGSDSIKLVVAIGPFVGIATLIAAVFAYLNENLLATAIFGPLAVFFFTIVLVGGLDAAVLCMFIGIIILVDALVAIYQPVKMLPILLIIAAIAFFVTAVWYNDPTDGTKSALGGLWILYSIISWYMAAAIIMLVLKGKQVLPLLIKA